MLRTHKLSDINEKTAGKSVKVVGWVDRIRDHRKIIFIDLRDRFGKIQCTIKKGDKDFQTASNLTKESCIQLEGKIAQRPKGTENKEISTGKVELNIDKLHVFSYADRLPFELDSREEISEDVRLKYRYLDLRREKMKNNIIMRHKAIKFIRDFLEKEDFIEIQTPILTKSSPEGARDYLVPSRVHPGKFYALPQSPQQYKQLLMVAGMEKYFQIAPCFRDEDARAHRCPGEFYQLDLETSFMSREEILELTERLFTEMVKKVFPDKKLTFKKWPQLTYNEVMKKYKTDSPDLRKNKKDANELAFCWIIDFPLFQKQTEKDFFHGAGKKWGPSHHMFTMPKEEDFKYLNEKEAGKAKSYQYDLVLNGYEVGGGSIRIHIPEIQEKIFKLIGFSSKQKKEFDHMLTAFKYGVPPHGGIAPGIDRLLMVIMGEPHIREVVAFPKNREAKDLTMDAPSEIDEKQLKEANIEVRKESKGKK